MSLPHWIFECTRCAFNLAAGPDRFPQSNESGAPQLWGNLCACDHCGSVHLVAEPGPLPAAGRHLFARILREAGKRRPVEWRWLRTEQFFEYLPAFAIGAGRGPEVVDISGARCTACGQHGFKAWLYPGMACPTCKEGTITESSTEA